MAAPTMDAEALLEAYRAMIVSRKVEEFCISKSAHWYPSIGEEAVVVGTFSAIGSEDFAVPHYRGSLIVPWLRGRPLAEVLACVEQKRISPTRGRLYGGFAGDLGRGVFPYITMVLGPNLAVAAGTALAFKTKGEARVAVATLGDGTAGTGDFHESLNLAQCLTLPVVFICQNNQFSISTSTQVSLAGESISEWAAGYGMPSRTIDGNDVEEVFQAVSEAVAAARGGAGPSFIEAQTFRRTGHFIADPAPYRDPDVLEAWAARDPITCVETRLRDRGTSEAALTSIRDEVSGLLTAAAAEVDSAGPLTASDLGTDEVFHRTARG